MALTTFSGPVVSQNGFIDSSFTTAERDAIPNPQAGLLIYNTDTNTYQVYNGSTWVSAFGGGPAPVTYPFTFTLASQTTLANKLYTIPPSGNAIQFVNAGGFLQSTPLLTPWDASTRNLGGAVVSPALTGILNPQEGFAWNNNGTQAAVIGDAGGNGLLYQVSFSTPYNVTSFTAATQGFTYGFSLSGAVFGDSGNKLYAMRSNGTLVEFTLAAPYDVISSPTSTQTFAVRNDLGLATSPQQATFNSAGTVGVVFEAGGSDTGVITQFQLGTPWDISTINIGTAASTPLSAGIIGVNSSGGVLKPDSSTFITSAISSDSNQSKVYQFTIS